jgi:hypothetical protein
VIALVAALSFGLVGAQNASAEGPDDSNLAARFKHLSQHGNVECSGQFEKSIATMPQDAKLQGSCCAPMDEVRYGQQIEGLKKYADIAEVPPDPYDIAAPLAHKLMGYYDMALNKDEQAAYDYAMEHSEMQGPCCCKCWRWKVYGGLGKLFDPCASLQRPTTYRPLGCWPRLRRRQRYKDALSRSVNLI